MLGPGRRPPPTAAAVGPGAGGCLGLAPRIALRGGSPREDKGQVKATFSLLVGACSFVLLLPSSLQAGNTVSGTSTGSGVGSGDRNLIYNSLYARIGGGFTNVIVTGANFSTIGGGYSNGVSSATFATIGGGANNLVSSNSTNATIGGGVSNRVYGAYTFIGGGFFNEASGFGASVGGGLGNAATGRSSTIGGGFGSVASGTNSAIGGGSANSASAPYATVGGGQFNTAGSDWAVVGGGNSNSATGQNATVPGGIGNTASGGTSFAAGNSATASHSLAFVWGGALGATTSTNAGSFTARAPGGVRFISTASGETGVILAASATAWAVLSDSNAKTGVHPINPRQILAKVAALPVTAWDYKHDPGRTYIGPMAQDFHAAFGLGADDKTINSMDADGVTLAAIQGLVEELKERDAEIAEMRAELREVRQRLNSLPPAP